MPKRPPPALSSSSKLKRTKTTPSNQHNIHSFFTSSSFDVKRVAPKVELETVVIDLSLDDSEDDASKSMVALSMPATRISPSTGPSLLEPTNLSAPKATSPVPVKPVDPGANPLLSIPDFSEDPLSFSLATCPWDTSQPAPYVFLVHALVTLSSTRSRITIINTLVNTLRLLIHYDGRRSLLPALYIFSNCLAPSYEGVELNVGPSIVAKAIQGVSGMSAGALRTMSHKLGDPGDVAFAAKSSLRTLRPVPPLQLASTHAQLLKISALKGQASAKTKQAIIEKLLVAARGEEVRYLVRTLSLNLRVGAVRTTILTALGRALVLTPPTGTGEFKGLSIVTVNEVKDSDEEVEEPKTRKGKGKGKAKAKDDPEREELLRQMTAAEALVKQVYVRHPHFGQIVDAVLESGLEGLAEKVQLTVGIPLHPTLGSPTRSLDEIYDRLGDLPFSAEFKYDGQRVQIHASRSASGGEYLSLRFPRFIKVREDKALTDASGPEFLASLWRKQEGKGGGADEGDLVDASDEDEEEDEDELE